MALPTTTVLATTPETELASAVRALVIAGDRCRLRMARDSLGMGATEVSALAALAMDGPRTPTQLAERMQITTPSATELVDRLQRAGLVQRGAHHTDRRKVLVSLTDAGRYAMATVVGRFTDAVTNVAATRSPGERGMITRFLRDTATELESLRAPTVAETLRPPVARIGQRSSSR